MSDAATQERSPIRTDGSLDTVWLLQTITTLAESVRAMNKKIDAALAAEGD